MGEVCEINLGFMAYESITGDDFTNYFVPKRVTKEIRADERKKVLDEVIRVLVDLGYGDLGNVDEENGAEWAYMVALYNVARRIKQMKGERT